MSRDLHDTRRRPAPGDRGFTIIELVVAMTISFLVIVGAFVGLTSIQSEASRQRRSVEIVGPARQALDILARDIRMAGDSANLFADCIVAFRNPLATLPCPAVLDAHPWRLTLARNAWGLDETFTVEDELPVGATLESNPRNVVTWQFEPTERRTVVHGGAERDVVFGRLVRIQNPFGFLDEEPQRAVVLDNVIVDDAMRVDPATGASDPRYDHAVFTFQLLGRETEYDGDDEIVDRVTSAKDLTNLSLFLTPPVRFFDPLDFVDGLPEPSADLAYSADYGETAVRGLRKATASGLPADGAKLFAASIIDDEDVDAMDPTLPQSDLRRVLDQNRIRTVRVAFKVFDPREERRRRDGLDLDGDPSNGTAEVFAFEAYVGLRVLNGDRSGF